MLKAATSVQFYNFAISIVDEFSEPRQSLMPLLKELLSSRLRILTGFQLLDECVDSLEVLRDFCILSHGYVNSHNPSTTSRSTTRTAMIDL